MIKKVLVLLILVCSIGFSQSSWVTKSVVISPNPPVWATGEMPYNVIVRMDTNKIIVYSKPVKIFTIRKFYNVYETPMITTLIMNAQDQSGKQVYLQLVEKNQDKSTYFMVEYTDYIIMFKIQEWVKQ